MEVDAAEGDNNSNAGGNSRRSGRRRGEASLSASLNTSEKDGAEEEEQGPAMKRNRGEGGAGGASTLSRLSAGGKSKISSTVGSVDMVPFGVMFSPNICSLEVHAKTKKNCAMNPWCVYGLGEYNEGIWKKNGTINAQKYLGPNVVSLIRKPYPEGGNVSARFPVGLRNLGATCYLNVLMQGLFHNKLIRNAVFDMNTTQDEHDGNVVVQAVKELQRTFAYLQYSDSCSFNLNEFVKLLQLNAGEQQDPLEFNALFFDKCFDFEKPSVLPEPAIPAVNTLLSGKEAYITSCFECKEPSGPSVSFRDFSVGIESYSTLEEAIEGHFEEEQLQGDNQYFCGKCECKHDAVRRCEIKIFPEVLFLTLRRYVYDVTTSDKKKLKNSISFPNNLKDFGKDNSIDYRLVTVLYHKGGSAHGGHYVADVLDWDLDSWWRCDDDKVVPTVNPSAKATATKPVEVIDVDNNDDNVDKAKSKAKAKAKSKASTPESSKKPKTSSASLDPFRDAYMLCYVKQKYFEEEDKKPPSVEPHLSIREEVNAANLTFQKSIEEYKTLEKRLNDVVCARKASYESIVDQLSASSSEDPFHLVPTTWLKQWVIGEVVHEKSAGAAVSTENSSEKGAVVDMTMEEVTDLTADDDSDPPTSSASHITAQDGQAEKILSDVFNHPIKNSNFCCRDHAHQQCISPSAITSFKVLSDTAFKAIMGDPSSPNHSIDVDLTADKYKCLMCIEDSKQKTQLRSAQTSQYQEILNGLETEKAEGGSEKPFWVSTKWISEVQSCCNGKNAKKGIDALQGLNHDLLCEHKQKAVNITQKRYCSVSNELWKIIQQTITGAVEIRGDADVCNTCTQKNAESKSAQSSKAGELKLPGLKELLKQADSIYPPKFVDTDSLAHPIPNVASTDVHETHYLVSKEWMKQWRAYHKENSKKPDPLDNEALRCEHGLSLLAEEMTNLFENMAPPVLHTVRGDGLPEGQLVTSDQWNSLVKLYGKASDDMDVPSENPSEPKLPLFTLSLTNLKLGPEICKVCTAIKKKDFDDSLRKFVSEQTFSVSVLAPGDPVPGAGADSIDSSSSSSAPVAVTSGGAGSGQRSQRSRRSNPRRKAAHFEIHCTPSDTVYDAKLRIYHALLQLDSSSEVYPKDQILYWKGAELTNTSKLGDCNLIEGAKLYVSISEIDSTASDLIELDETGRRKAESGFSGTFLSFSRAPAPPPPSSATADVVDDDL